MQAAFPGDPTTGTTVREVSLLHLHDYAERVLFRDSNLSLCMPPRVVCFDGGAARDTDVHLDFSGFCSRMNDLKYHSDFSGYDGESNLTDFIAHFGRLHSTDRESLGAFKHFAYLAVTQYWCTHNQFAQRPFSSEAVHFFHVFDNETAEENWHCHFVLLPT